MNASDELHQVEKGEYLVDVPSILMDYVRLDLEWIRKKEENQNVACERPNAIP